MYFNKYSGSICSRCHCFRNACEIIGKWKLWPMSVSCSHRDADRIVRILMSPKCCSGSDASFPKKKKREHAEPREMIVQQAVAKQHVMRDGGWRGGGGFVRSASPGDVPRSDERQGREAFVTAHQNPRDSTEIDLVEKSTGPATSTDRREKRNREAK